MSIWASLPAFIGKYNLGQTLGKGSFSLVKEGIDTETHAKYAVKIIPKSNMNTDADRERFEREVNVILKMNHPGIIKIINFLVDSNFFFLIMEFVDGGTLLSQLSAPASVNENSMKPVFKQILETVQYIHSQGIAHRDLKLENVLYDTTGNIKIIDFGFSRFANPGQLFATPCGSPAYAAPEVLSGQNYDGKAADMWSLGVLLFGLVTGDLPWKTSNKMGVYQQILKGQLDFPPGLSVLCTDLISKLLSPDPIERYTASESLKHPWLEGIDVSWNEPQGIQPSITERTFHRMLSSCDDFTEPQQDAISALTKLTTRSRKLKSQSFGNKTIGNPHNMMKYAGNIIPMKGINSLGSTIPK